MLEWMHDEELVRYLHKDFASMTIEDCKRFIASSLGGNSIHLAIVDDNDEYLGTCSLKNINEPMKTAEFGIVIRRKAFGKKSSEAMKQIIQQGFDIRNLEYVL